MFLLLVKAKKAVYQQGEFRQSLAMKNTENFRLCLWAMLK